MPRDNGDAWSGSESMVNGIAAICDLDRVGRFRGVGRGVDMDMAGGQGQGQGQE